MRKTDIEFRIGISIIFFTALSSTIAVRSNINPIPSISIGAAIGVIVGVIFSEAFKDKTNTHQKESKKYDFHEDKIKEFHEHPIVIAALKEAEKNTKKKKRKSKKKSSKKKISKKSKTTKKKTTKKRNSKKKKSTKKSSKKKKK